MAVPLSQMFTVASYLLRQKLQGKRRYPLVLMLEPLYRCNLACGGCGKIQYPSHMLKKQLSVEDCLRAVDQCPAPIVSLPGGEPLLHPQIDEIVAALVARKKYVYLCTNGILLEDQLDRFTPSKYLSFSVHMDGLEPEHDAAVCRPGTYRKAYQAIQAALARGFRVTTNTTLFEGSDPQRTRDFFDEMMRLGVEGMMISPGYSYDKAPDREHFLRREGTRALFRRILAGGIGGWRFNQSPLFLEFLGGARDYDCTPWGNPTYSVFGWQKPCYLLQEGYEPTFAGLMERTDWSRYGHRSGNPKCRDCMVHCGFEASAVEEAFSSWRGLAAMARATLAGPRIPVVEAAADQVRSESARYSDSAQPTPLAGRILAATPAALRAAFDYRGDVTVELADGTAAEGFVSNLDEETLHLWRDGARAPQPIPAASIRSLRFTGRDMAAPET
ncbi:MAG TPA: adenosyl-hopene transferase HpnH [Terriglobales bacterium]|nr:adenosyl-hopene transferase HpnH [Terriglobales bacterium]